MNEIVDGNEDANGTGFHTGISWESAAGAVAWSSGGAVGAAPFYAAGEVLRGPVGATFTVSGAVIETGFNVGAVHTLVGQVQGRDLPGIVIGSVVGGFTGPVGGIVAGVVADQTLGRLVGTLEDLAALEDPDGGFNGANMQSRDYGSGMVPNDETGYGPAVGNGIITGNEYNELDEIAHLAATLTGQTYGPPAPSGGNNSSGGSRDRDRSNDNDGPGWDNWDRSGNDRAPSISNNGSIDRGNDNVSHGSGGGANSTVGRGSGGTGREENHSVPSSSGYSSRGVNDLDGPEAAGAGSSSGGSSNANHYDQVSKGNVRSGLPIILDLDGDGVDVSFGTNVTYDMDGDGFREQTAWAAPDDGLLVIDLEADGSISATGGDGEINQAQEVVFASWGAEGSTDLQALAEATDADGNLIFDSNGDGVLDSSDTVWTSMKVFQDLDQDGEVDEGELKTLDEWGISQINLSYDDGSGFEETDDNITVLGNTLHGLASFVMNGEVIEGGVGDVSLAYNQYGWRQVETATGYRIEFESGEAWAFWEAAGQATEDVDLAAGDYVGAYGDDRNNVLNAAAATSAVVIDGGAGADTITGGSGGDLISGGAGADVIDTGAGNDVVFADAEDNVAAGNVQGGEGYDQLIMAADAALNISDLAAIGFEAVEAGNEADSITGLDDEIGYYLSGNGGNDVLTTAGGNDILAGGADNDKLSSGAGDDRVFGGEGDDTIEGGAGDDFIAGGKDDDTLKGDLGNDRYYYQRGDGNDTIDERVFVGDEHSQRMAEMYARMAERTEASVARNQDRASDYRQRAADTGQDVYNRLATMFDGMADRSLARAEDYQDRANGYLEDVEQIDGGIDTLEFGYGIRAEDVLLEMQDGDAVITLRNQDDADTVADERDTVSTDDSITIKDWDDQRSRIENFSFASGTVLGTSQVLNGLTGHAAADTLAGTEDGDWINSGGGDDTLSGHEGNDVLIAGAGDDSLDGGAGRDVLYGGEGDDAVQGGDGNDYALGGTGNDSIDGGAGDDVLSGEAGDDNLIGGLGDDVLMGGSGSDTLNGGAGDDTYIYFRGDGQDVIHDYADEEQDVQTPNGSSIYQRSGKSGRYVQEMRTVQTMVQIDGGWDTLQFGYSVALEDVFFDLQGNDLVMGVRQLDADGNELTLDQMDDVVRVQDWANEMSRVEELRFGDGLAIDVSEFGAFQSGYSDDDSFTGTEEGDLLSGGGGNDALSGDAGNDVLVGGGGDDIASGGDGDDDVYGGAGDDTLSGDQGRDHLLGGAGDDEINGGDGDDVLVGGRGDDLLRGGRGNDTYIFNRGDGHDAIDESVFRVREDGTTTTEYGADDFALESQTHYTGGKSSHAYEKNVWVSDSRTGASIKALEGGDDVLQFGNWIDISDLTVNTDGMGATANLVIELAPVVAEGEITDSVTIDNWGTTEFRVETLRFSNGFVLDVSHIGHAQTGDEEDNVITATDLGAATNPNLVTGGSRSVLTSKDGVWLSGAAGADTLIGSAKADILMGGVGNDRLEGGAGNDTYVFGLGDGKDTIFDTGSTAVGNDTSALGGDKLLFGVGITIEDLILQKDGTAMTIYVADDQDMSVPLSDLTDAVTVENWSNAGNRIELLQFFNGLDFDVSEIVNTYLGADVTGPTATETPVDDTLNGSSLADWMDGFLGNDVLNGNAGNDFMFGRDGNDTLNGGNGDDIMTGGADNDVLNGGNGNDVMTGGADDDVLNGDGGNDVMMGGTGNDTLNGGAGNDLLVGDLGDDTIIASAGQDQIRFGFGDGNDTYQGNVAFRNTDVIVFEDNIAAEDIWFERLDNSLVVRLHGADDTFTFENWYVGDTPSAYVQGFAAGGEWLSYAQVNTLVDAMQEYVPEINDGTTAYGILPGETPESVLTAIDSAWV